MIRFVIATLLAIGLAGVAAAKPQKVILDTDFNTIGDDGQVLIMAAQLQKQGVIDLLGMTIVTGNDWLDQEVADALRAVERLGIDDKVGVHAGANLPLVHDPRSVKTERLLFGVGEDYMPGLLKPRDGTPDAPPDGFARRAKLDPEDAVDFIVRTVKANPNEVSILAIGPATNLALAIRKNPEIVPLIRRIVWMGGAIDVRGNTTPAAEMNIWTDPEAARIVLREPIEQVLVPLDVTNITQLDKASFDRAASVEGPVGELLRGSRMAENFRKDPKRLVNVYDTLALAYLVDASFARKVDDLYIDVDIGYGPGYGRTLGYWRPQPTTLLQKVKVVRTFDTRRFLDWWADLMSRPVPVTQKAVPARK